MVAFTPVVARKVADENLGKLVKAYFYGAAEARQTREGKWDDGYKRADPSYIDKAKVKGPFYVKAPYVYRQIETDTAQLMRSTVANGRYFAVRSTIPEYGSVGDIVGQLLENQIRRKTSDVNSCNEAVLERIAQMGSKYGIVAGLIEWHTGSSNCRLRGLHPLDFFPDWKHARWYIIRRVITLSELGEMAETLSAPLTEDRTDPETGEVTKAVVGMKDGGRALKAFNAVKDAIESGEKSGYGYAEYEAKMSLQQQTDTGRVDASDDGLFDEYVSADDDPSNARLVMLEWHESKDDGIVAQILPSWDASGHDLVFRAEESPYGCCTIVPFVPRAVDNEVYGYGMGEVVGHTSEAMDVFFRAQLRYIARVADPAVLYNKALRLRKEYLRSQSGISIPVTDTVNDMRYMDVPNNGFMQQAGFSFARQMADLGTGGSEVKRGQVGGASSATESAIAEASGTIPEWLMARRWARFLEQVGHVMLQILKVHVTEETAIPLLGRNSDKFLRLKPEYLKGTFEVRFGGSIGGVNSAARKADLRGMATTYGAAGVIDVAEVARADFEEGGWPDPDRFLLNKNAGPSVSPRHEHLALFDFAQDIEVSPQDDHMAHMAAHFKEMQTRAPTGHPALPLLQQHLQTHVMLFQQQQAAALPQQGGAAPMTPDQAGQPGQPAAFTERAAALNDDRQMSNESALNGAPGPTAPNRPTGSFVRGPSR